MEQEVIIAFLLTLFAGLSTGIGSLLVFCTKTSNTKFLSFSLGFSAGVMIYVSLVDIFAVAQESLVAELGSKMGSWLTVTSFFAGMILIMFIDKCILKENDPHQFIDSKVNRNQSNKAPHAELLKMGTFTAIAMAIHNFPEGIATLVSALQDPVLGVVIAVAIAIHNIPEGIAVAVPIYYATNDKRKAFRISLLTGLTEPLGAITAYLLLMPFLNDTMFGIIFAMVAGIMVYISLDELLPAAKKYDGAQLSMYGLICGMAVIAISILLLM